MRAYIDEVRFEEGGRAVRMRKRAQTTSKVVGAGEATDWTIPTHDFVSATAGGANITEHQCAASLNRKHYNQ